MAVIPRIRIRNPFHGKPIRRIQREVYQRVYDYPYRNILIVSLPKSGSSWLFRMLRAVPGYLHWEPNYLKFLWHDLHYEYCLKPAPGYTVTKTHTRPTWENIKIIEQTGNNYIILLRDLRDVAVSWCFYVGNTPHHRLHHMYKPMSIQERLDWYMKTMLPEFIFWVENWQARRNPEKGLIVCYEDLRGKTYHELSRIYKHCGIDLPESKVHEIVDRHSFRRETGRDPGQEDPTQFNRKAVVGDWINHFTPELKDRFKEMAGETLIKLGYEDDLNW
ncbi:MAG: sulfotransferase domain-containing protein [Phycisphaerales bacterium]